MANGTAPPQWTKSASNPLIQGAAAGLDQLGFPTVIVATGRLASPIDTYYLWCAPHDPPGGIFLFTASSPEGPWTIRNSGNPVIATPAAASHISSPYVIWDPVNSRLVMWAHWGGGSLVTQSTWLYYSTDGITWTIQNSGNPILTQDTAGTVDEADTTYLKPYWDGSQWVGYFDGSKFVTFAVHICRATSPDGLVWTRDEAGATGSFDFQNTQGTFNGCPLALDGGVAVYYDGIFGTGKARDAFYRQKFTGRSDYTGPRFAGLPVGTVWDTKLISFNDFIYVGGKFYGFYIGSTDPDSNVGQGIGVAYATYPQAGFDISHGKG